jgi:hypothetical protein
MEYPVTWYLLACLSRTSPAVRDDTSYNPEILRRISEAFFIQKASIFIRGRRTREENESWIVRT